MSLLKVNGYRKLATSRAKIVFWFFTPHILTFFFLRCEARSHQLGAAAVKVLEQVDSFRRDIAALAKRLQPATVASVEVKINYPQA